MKKKLILILFLLSCTSKRQENTLTKQLQAGINFLSHNKDLQFINQYQLCLDSNGYLIQDPKLTWDNKVIEYRKATSEDKKLFLPGDLSKPKVVVLSLDTVRTDSTTTLLSLKFQNINARYRLFLKKEGGGFKVIKDEYITY